MTSTISQPLLFNPFNIHSLSSKFSFLFISLPRFCFAANVPLLTPWHLCQLLSHYSFFNSNYPNELLQIFWFNIESMLNQCYPPCFKIDLIFCVHLAYWFVSIAILIFSIIFSSLTSTFSNFFDYILDFNLLLYHINCN